MAGGDPVLNRPVGLQGTAALSVTSHLDWAVRRFGAQTFRLMQLRLQEQQLAVVAVVPVLQP